MKNIPQIRFPEFSGEWEEKRLGEIGNIKYGKGQNEIKNKIGNFPIIGTSGILGTSGEYLYDKESVILGRKGTIDKPIYINKPFWCVDTTFFFEFYKAYVPKFIFYLLNKINWKIYNESTGVPSLSLNTIKKIKIHIPEPKEQQKIASFLSAVDEKIELTTKRIEKLKEYKKGLLQKLLNVKNGVPKLRFPEFSGEWIERRLGEVATIKKGIQLNKLNMIENGQYPVINGGIEASGYTNDFNTNENTITISEGGNSCGYVNFIKTKFWCGGHCYKLESIKVNKKYLYFILKKEETKIMRLRVGSGLPNIQKNDLVKYKLYFPPTLAEQQKIASFLSGIDEKIELNEQVLDKMKEYKRGLLQKMFV